MTALLNPYLSFRDQARAAMTYYQQVFGGELSITTFGEFGDPGDKDAPEADLVMHARLDTADGLVLMGADTPPHMEHTQPTGITVSLTGDEPEKLRGWFDGLADGGTVTMPLEQQVWGDEFGMCVDRFGVPWMVDIGGAEG